MFPQRPIPDRIGSYNVERRLASRDGADLYLAKEEGPRGFVREVLLKLVTPSSQTDESVDVLSREAMTVASLKHPHIQRMLQFFEFEEHLVLVMERNEGTYLQRLLSLARRRREKLPDEVVFAVGHGLASALAYAHALEDDRGEATPVIHRAISPAVVQLSNGGDVILSGFGMAKMLGRSPDTAVGLIKGTPGYMAPEQLRGERITTKVDVYQLGLILWEMLSGNSPMGNRQTSRQKELVHMMAGERLPSIQTVRPKCSPELSALVDAALEPNPEKRTIGCADIESWLANATDLQESKQSVREWLQAGKGVGQRGGPQSQARLSFRSSARRKPHVVERVPKQPVRGTGRPSQRPKGAPQPVPVRVEKAVLSSRPPIQIKDAESSGAMAIPRAPSNPNIPAVDAATAKPPPTPASSGSIAEAEPVEADCLADTAPPPPPNKPPAPPAKPPPPPGFGDRTMPAQSGMAAPAAAPLSNPVEVAGNLSAPRVPMPSLADHRGAYGVGLPSEKKGIPKPVLIGAAAAGGVLLLIGLVVAISSGGDDKPKPKGATSAKPAKSAAAAPPSPKGTGEDAPPKPKPTASAKPTATATKPPADDTPVPRNRAAVTVNYPQGGTVYIFGRAYGKVGERLIVPCGHQFLRVGDPKVPGRHLVWRSEGKSQLLVCGKSSTVELR